MMLNTLALNFFYVMFFSVSSLPAMYTLNVQIEHVQDMRISAVITTLKKVLAGHTISISMTPEVGFLASLYSLLPFPKASLSKGLGVSILSYCSLVFIIYRVYSVVKTVGSFIPFMSQPHSLVKENFEQKLSFKIYFNLVQILNKLNIRFLFPYDKILEERALFVYSKIFADE